MINDSIQVDGEHRNFVEFDEAPERRESKRARAVLRVVKVRALEDEGLARLQNISDGGMMLRFDLPVDIGVVVTVYLADDKWVSARVIWIEGKNCGLELTDAMDSAALLAEMAEGARDGSLRPMRLQADASGIAYTESGTHPIQVKDVSQCGMKVQHRSALLEGVWLKIRLMSGLERRGVVRWSKGDMAGIQLLEPVSLDQLSSAKRL